MKNIGKKLGMFLLVCLMILMFVPGVKAHAATGKVVPISYDKNYTSYDINKDGRNDTLKIKNVTGSDGSKYARVYVNGVRVRTVNLARGGYAYLCYQNTNNIFLLFKSGQFGANDCSAYAYRSGKLTCVYSSFQKRAFDYVGPSRIVDGVLYMESSLGKHQWLFSNCCYERSVYIRYEISNAKLSLISPYVKAYGSFKAEKSFFSTSGPKTTDAKGVFVKKGDIVKLLKFSFAESNRPRVKIEVNGKTGWIYTDGNDVTGKGIDMYGALTTR